MFRILFRTENDAFADDSGRSEVARILRKIAQDVEFGNYPDNLFHTIHDANGNDIGRWRLTDAENEWREKDVLLP